MSSLTIRTVVNSLLALSGGLTISSGLFLFFHIKTSIIVITHEYGGIAFAIACVLHLALNWKPLLHTLKGRGPAFAMLVIILLSTLAMWYTTTLPNARRNPRERQHSAIGADMQSRWGAEQNRPFIWRNPSGLAVADWGCLTPCRGSSLLSMELLPAGQNKYPPA